MAKLKCKLVSIYAPRNDEKAILRRLQEMSVMDIESAAEDEETSALPEGFTKTDTEDRVAAYERNAETAAAAIKILNTRAPRKKGISGMFGEVFRAGALLFKTRADRKRVIACKHGN